MIYQDVTVLLMRSRNWHLDQYPYPPVRTREPGGELGIRSVGSSITVDHIRSKSSKFMKLFQEWKTQTYLQNMVTDCMILMSRRGSRFLNCGMRRLILLSPSNINFINFINFSHDLSWKRAKTRSSHKPILARGPILATRPRNWTDVLVSGSCSPPL